MSELFFLIDSIGRGKDRGIGYGGECGCIGGDGWGDGFDYGNCRGSGGGRGESHGYGDGDSYGFGLGY